MEYFDLHLTSALSSLLYAEMPMGKYHDFNVLLEEE